MSSGRGKLPTWVVNIRSAALITFLLSDKQARAFSSGPAHIRWMKNDSEGIRHGTGIYSGSRTTARFGLKYSANGLRERKGSTYV
jgi:hypothetical protein